MNINPSNLGHYVVPDAVRGGRCVDIGANVGNFFSRWARFFSQIHYYEPFVPCFDICLAKSKRWPHVTGFNEAVFGLDGLDVEIVAHSNNDSGSNGIRQSPLNDDWTGSVVGSARSVSIETIVGRIGGAVDYLKCDCENSEYPLLIGKDLTPIDYLACELHCQMGAAKFHELVTHIKLTHDVVGAEPAYIVDLNCDALFCRKTSRA